MATTYRHIIWDWNGTILDDVDTCVHSVNCMLSARNLPQVTRGQYLELFDFPVFDYYRLLGFDLQNEDRDALAREFHRHYAEYSVSVGLHKDAVNTIRTLRQHNIPSSILSASETSILEKMLNEHKIRNLFEYIYGLDNLYAASKLERGRELIKRLQIPPRQTILIGDTNHDLEVAEALGIKCILIAGGHQARKRLQAPLVLSSASELLEAIALS